jgi:hypothetical protein
MTIQSLGKGIMQASDESTSNQESKKHQRGTYKQWCASHHWPHIQLIMKKHANLTSVLHHLRAFQRKSMVHTSPFHKLSRPSLI